MSAPTVLSRSFRNSARKSPHALPGHSIAQNDFCCVLSWLRPDWRFMTEFSSPSSRLHFTRGYVWMPLFLLGLPVIMGWWNHIRDRSPRYITVLLMMTVFADDFVFSAVHTNRQLTQVDGFHLDADERTLLSSLHGRRGPVLLEPLELNYLLPSYADARPWLGHHF